jgi:hypothetical protein
VTTWRFNTAGERGATAQTLRGSIEDARIYNRALTGEEIGKLKPDKESAIRPFAWWTFEKETTPSPRTRIPHLIRLK